MYTADMAVELERELARVHERLAQAEAKVARVEAAMAAFEKDVANPGASWVSTGMRALYNFRAALSGEETRS
jgi:hypothetical protein